MRKLKNFISTKVDRVKSFVRKKYIQAAVALRSATLGAKAALTSNSGESYVDTALKILICVVLGALLLATLYTIFKDNVLKTLNDRITELFNYGG